MSTLKIKGLLPIAMLMLLVALWGCDGKSSKSASDYDSVIVGKCRKAFTIGRKMQNAELYDRAIAAYRTCLKYQSTDSCTRDSLSFYIVNSMLQMMNSYQASGKTKECAEYYENLYCNPATPMIRQYFMRDLCAIYAYALYRNDDMAQAKSMIRQALKMRYTKPTHEQLFRDYSYATVIFFSDPARQDLVIRYGQRALSESEYCPRTSGEQWLVSVLADYYDRRGEISKAISLHERAIKVAKSKHDTLGLTHALMGLSAIYIEWDMPVYANECAQMAIAKIKGVKKYPDIIASAYIGKARALKTMARYDSMYLYLNEAKAYCKDLPYGNGMSSIEYLEGSSMVERGRGDSLRLGESKLQRVVQNSLMENKASAYFSLAKMYFRQYDNRRGESMLDSMYNVSHQSGMTCMDREAYLYAFKYYISQGDSKNIIRYGKVLAEENEFNQSRRAAGKLADLMVKMNTEKKEQQIRSYKIEAENGKLRFSIYVYVSLTILLSLALALLYRKKMYGMRTMLMNERLEILTQKMQQEMEQHQATKEKLSLLTHNVDVQRNVQNLSAEMIKEAGELEFKRHFEILYPYFIPRLRMLIENPGPREELVCMLTALGQDNNHISRLLCIAYRSVVMSKHRLKQKMGLGAADSFDETIRNLIDK